MIALRAFVLFCAAFAAVLADSGFKMEMDMMPVPDVLAADNASANVCLYVDPTCTKLPPFIKKNCRDYDLDTCLEIKVVKSTYHARLTYNGAFPPLFTLTRYADAACTKNQTSKSGAPGECFGPIGSAFFTKGYITAQLN